MAFNPDCLLPIYIKKDPVKSQLLATSDIFTAKIK